MKIATNIAGGLLGFVFVVLPLMILLKLMPMPPPPPADSPAGMFMGAMFPTGYMTAVQILEIVGGVLVAIPRTRNFGLLVLGPIVINILFYHVFIMQGGGLIGPPLLVAALAVFLLFAERRAFLGLIHRG